MSQALTFKKLDRAGLAAYAAIDPEGHWSEDWGAPYTETCAGTPLPETHSDHAADRKMVINHLNCQRATPRGPNGVQV